MHVFIKHKLYLFAVVSKFTIDFVQATSSEHQQDYYNVIAKSDAAGNSTMFVEFMLKCLLDAMENYEDIEEEKEELHDKYPELSEKAFGILEILRSHPGLKAEEIGKQVALSERQVKTYLNALKQAGLIVRVGSNKTGYWEVIIA